MVAVPTPYDATSGFKLTAADWDLGVRDPLLFLMTAYPRVHAWSNTGLVCTSATAKGISFDSEVYDTDSMHEPTTHPSRITATSAGLYEFHWHIRMPSATYTQLDLDIRLNANFAIGGGTAVTTQAFASGATFRYLDFTYHQFMNAGDYHEAFVTQNSGGGSQTTITGQFSTFCQARWIATS